MLVGVQCIILINLFEIIKKNKFNRIKMDSIGSVIQRTRSGQVHAVTLKQ